MSPTCTLPYEVLLELVNNTRHSVTMQAQHPEDGTRSGATILMHSAESISLVLTAGLPYRYGIRQHGKEACLSVKIWHDTICDLSTVFAASVPTMSPSDGTYCVTDGIKVAFASCKSSSSFRRIADSPEKNLKKSISRQTTAEIYERRKGGGMVSSRVWIDS